MSGPLGSVLARMDDDGIDGLLAEIRRSAHLSTVTPTGRPQVGPVWFWWDRPVCWIVSFRDTLRVRNVEANPYVSLSIDVDRFPARGAIMHGQATLEDPLGDVIEHIVERYVPAPRVAEMVSSYLADPNRVMLRVQTSRVSGWDGRPADRPL
jgi:PPOX class probable F420-dependent enzyme